MDASAGSSRQIVPFVRPFAPVPVPVVDNYVRRGSRRTPEKCPYPRPFTGRRKVGIRGESAPASEIRSKFNPSDETEHSAIIVDPPTGRRGDRRPGRRLHLRNLAGSGEAGRIE